MRVLCAGGVIAGSVSLTFCDRIVDPPLPGDAEQFEPPPVFSTWWAMTEACSGRTGSLDAVTWYQTSEDLVDPHTHDAVAGYWTSGSNRIVLRATVMLDGAIVRHEMLHSLLNGGGHPRDEFLGKCGGTVQCVGTCVNDAGVYPEAPETPVLVRADAFDITLDVEPATPSREIDGGFFSITVTARNTTAHWASAAPIAPDVGPNVTFGYNVSGANGGGSGHETAFDPSQRIFAPGETKKHVFDFRIGDDAFGKQLPPGEYSLSAGFSDHWSDPASLTINP